MDLKTNRIGSFWHLRSLIVFSVPNNFVLARIARSSCDRLYQFHITLGELPPTGKRGPISRTVSPNRDAADRFSAGILNPYRNVRTPIFGHVEFGQLDIDRNLE